MNDFWICDLPRCTNQVWSHDSGVKKSCCEKHAFRICKNYQNGGEKLAESKELSTVEILQDGIVAGDVKREKGDLATVPRSEAKILLENNLAKETSKNVASGEASEITANADEEEGESLPEIEGPLTGWNQIEQELDNPQREWPQEWLPEQDNNPDKLLGKVVEARETQYGRSIIIEDRNGQEWTVHQKRKALDNFCENANREDKIGLKYLGQKKSGDSGRTYHDYNHVIK